MPTHDYIIANGTGAAVRADINLALSAIVSLNSSASEPGTMYAYQLWADTAAGLLKIRNGANSAWITLRQLDGDFSIVAVEDGLQATPSLTFTNDLNTGVFRSGADALAIVTGGQYAITCTSTQAVGIRTPNPSTALHVAGNARVGADDVTDAVLEIGVGASGNRTSYIDIVADTTYTDYGLRIIRNNTGANATSELKHRGTGALNITTQEAAPIEFYTTNSPRLTILAGGNVGIGTSLPDAALHVVGSAILTGAVSVGTTASATSLQFPAVTGWGPRIQQGGASINDFGIFTNNTEHLTVKNSGNVGIGTTNPGSYSTYGNKLVVYGTGTNGPGITIATGAADTGSLYFADGTTGNEVARGAVSYSHGDDALLFQTSATEKVRIDSSGRLLVGTSSAVAGTAQTASIVGSTLTQSTGLQSVGSGGTLDLALLGNEINGHLYVSYALAANTYIRTSKIFFIETRLNDNTVITELNTNSGSGGGRSFTITNPSATTFRLTDTSSSACTASMSFVGNMGA